MRPVLNGRAVFASTVPVTILKFHVNTVHTLKRRGYDVTLVSTEGPDLDEAAERSGSVARPIPMSRSISPVKDLAAMLRWLSLLVRIKPGIVVAGTPKCALLALTAARATAVPRRVYLCGGLRHEGERGWRRQLLVAMERMAMRAATEVVVNSRSLYEEVLDSRLARPSALRQILPGSSHGVDSTHFRPGPANTALREQLGVPKGVPVLGFVGRLTRDKGVETLIRASELLRDRGESFHLLVIGPQDEPDSHEWLVRLRECGISLTVTGAVADPSEYYRLMTLLLLPSRREGFPNVVLEAAATGVACLTTDCTGCRDAVLDGITGHIAPVDDATAFADAAQMLLGDSVALDRMGEAARQWVVTEFKPDEIADQIVNLSARRALVAKT